MSQEYIVFVEESDKHSPRGINRQKNGCCTKKNEVNWKQSRESEASQVRPLSQERKSIKINICNSEYQKGKSYLIIIQMLEINFHSIQYFSICERRTSTII